MDNSRQPGPKSKKQIQSKSYLDMFQTFPQFSHDHYFFPGAAWQVAPVSPCQFFWQPCGSANVGRGPRSDEVWKWSPHHPVGLGNTTPALTFFLERLAIGGFLKIRVPLKSSQVMNDHDLVLKQPC